MFHKMSLITSLIIGVMFYGCGNHSDQPAASDGDGQWISLVNGTDLTGWIPPQFGTCSVEDGMLVLTGVEGRAQPEQKWLLSQASFENFMLRFQYYCEPGCNSGVALRYPGHGNPAYTGYEVQIMHATEMNPTGSIYNVSRAYAEMEGKPVAPDEQWNSMEIRCTGDEITVTVNGHRVAYGRDRRSLAGAVGFQIHDAHTRMKLRNIEIQELPDTPLESPIEEYLQNAGGEFTRLYNGKDLSGWKVYWGGDWKADGDDITGTIQNGIGWLLTEQEYGDFILSCDVKISSGGNSGLLIRYPLPENPEQRTQAEAWAPGNEKLRPAYAGHEVQAWDYHSPVYTNPSGSIYDVGRAYGYTYSGEQPVFLSGEWNHYLIYARGPQLRTYINGQKVAEAYSDRSSTGCIGLQVHVMEDEIAQAGITHAPYRVWFKNIFVKAVH